MKLFQQLLVAPAALGLLASGANAAARLGGWAVDQSQRGDQTKGGGRHQQSLDKRHDWKR